jgi:hypothetical protein
MVEIVFDRTDSGSVATILVGDAIVVRVRDTTDTRCWVVEDSGSLRLDSTEEVGEGDASARERLLRFSAVAIGETNLRLALRDENARLLDTLALVVEVHERQPPSSLHLLRKKA